MKNLSRNDARQKIEDYFSKENLNFKETKKIKKLAMSHKIRLGDYRKRFCKKCLNDLKFGKIKISKNYKQVICNKCNTVNKWKIKIS